MVRLTGVFLIFSLFECAGWAAKAVSPGSGNPQVVVSVYNQAGVPFNVISRAEEETGRVLHQASISFTWINCPTIQIGIFGCQKPAAARTLMLRIVPRALTLSDTAFGAAFLGADGSGEYADVFFASVQRLQDRESQASQAQVLGYVMAHEIGHLLLGSNAHSNVGVMRPHWSGAELQSIAMGRLSFTRDQCLQIRARLDAEASADRTDPRLSEVIVTSWLN